MTKMTENKVKSVANHPPAIDMIKAALKSNDDKKGMSLIHIKKFVSDHYKINMEKYAPFLRRALSHAVTKGALLRVGNKGKGVLGSFKLSSKKSTEESKMKKIVRKPSVKKEALKKVKLPKKKSEDETKKAAVTVAEKKETKKAAVTVAEKKETKKTAVTVAEKKETKKAAVTVAEKKETTKAAVTVAEKRVEVKKLSVVKKAAEKRGSKRMSKPVKVVKTKSKARK